MIAILMATSHGDVTRGGKTLSRKYSIAEAKNNLARLVHEAEDGSPVELTRRGKSVAVVVSLTEYRRLSAPRRNFWEACTEFRASHDLEELDIHPEELLAGTRDPHPGGDFSW